jgi:hypothetical protein
MKSSDDLIRDFALARKRRDDLRRERAGLFCARAEPVSPQDYDEAHAEAQSDPMATFVFPEPTQAEPCWKAARKWRDDGYHSKFYFDPPQSEWCEPCRRRQAVSDLYRVAVRRHGGALRGLLSRAKALLPAAGEAPTADSVSTVSDAQIQMPSTFPTGRA